MTTAERIPSKALSDPVESLFFAAKQIWFAGLGTAVTAASGAHLVFRAMVEEGEKFARRERPDVEKALVVASDRVKEMSEQVEVAVEETMSAGLQRIGVPTRSEIRELSTRVELLSARLRSVGIDRSFRGAVGAPQQKPN